MKVGLKQLCYAILTNPDTEHIIGPQYVATKFIIGTNKATLGRKNSRDTFYADNGPWDSVTGNDVSSLELIVATLLPETYAEIMGHDMVGAEVFPKNGDIAPYLAVGYQATKSTKMANGTPNSIYRWLYKGQFEPNQEEDASKGATAKLNPLTITATFLGHQFDSRKERFLDTESASYVSGQEATFFDSPLATYDPTLLAISSTSPANATTGVSTTATVIWTFNKKLQSACINAANFFVSKGSALITGTLSVDTTGEIITFTPSVALSTGVYNTVANIGIQDTFGIPLALPSVTTFTV
jgi:phi13 family phage major tail protein